MGVMRSMDPISAQRLQWLARGQAASWGIRSGWGLSAEGQGLLRRFAHSFGTVRLPASASGGHFTVVA